MFAALFKFLFGSRNDRQVRRYQRIVQQINSLEEEYQALSDNELAAQTQVFRDRLDKGETLSELLVEAFATVREASRRKMGMRHFDVQLIGGMVLNHGRIAEMKTGEGKTLVATLAVYLNALPGEGVHVVTVNDYLARRDADWMRPLYEFLGLSVGIVVSGQTFAEKHQAYQCDITYGTNNEFGFDYLRDNMAPSVDERAQRGTAFAIVDEVDSILIDEARTPLIISGAQEDSSSLYQAMDKLVPLFEKGEASEDKDIPSTGDFVVDEKFRSIEITDQGHEKLEALLLKHGLLAEGEGLYLPQNLKLLHHAKSALSAHHLFHKDVEYMVMENQVVLIDEHTGRTMEGRRLSEGLHQAIEAKEKVKVQAESKTLASITFQNYFRLYDKLSGMTGTADTEAREFQDIYDLEVIVIPTNKPMLRKDRNDLVYMRVQDKFKAILTDIQKEASKGRPVLVGTTSVEMSERLSSFLSKKKIKHETLNAKNHLREADIIAEAGRPGAVTIATNMAGRGTDIKLGGNWEVEVASQGVTDEQAINAIKAEVQKRHDQVIEAGGLHVIGSERHESRRIDNQLRGRSGRQGDPGSTRFYVCVEDPLMRIFAGDRMRNFMQSLMGDSDEAIENSMISRSIEKAQRKVEGRNYDNRKVLLEYDDIANEQRQLIYAQRDEIMESEDVSDFVESMANRIFNQAVETYCPPGTVYEQWDLSGLEQHIKNEFGYELPIEEWLEEDKSLDDEDIKEKVLNHFEHDLKEKEGKAGKDALQGFEKNVLMGVLDETWKEHLQSMTSLRQNIGLRSYAQKNPKQEFKREAFDLFQETLNKIRMGVTQVIARVQIQGYREPAKEQPAVVTSAADQEKASPAQQASTPTPVQPRTGEKVGRNQSCPCGSGKKYKNCCGKQY